MPTTKNSSSRISGINFKFLILVLLLSLLVYVSGCVNIEIKQKIKSNGNSEIEAVYDLSSMYNALSRNKPSDENCTLPPGLTCMSHNIEPAQATIGLYNGLGKAITVSSIGISGCKGSFNVTMASGNESQFAMAGCDNGEAADTFEGELEVEYTEKATGLQNTAYGNVYGNKG